MTSTDRAAAIGRVARSGIVVEGGELAIVLTLDRPRALNALTTVMVRVVKDVVDGADRPVVIRSTHPRAFCAGGDIRAIREYSLTKQYSAITDFFTAEYAMNLAIAEADPPAMSIVDGICMGGGIGVAGHSRVRVVTERASLAMPESAIGFFPDVGVSHLLANAPGEVGLYLGMTGARIGALDAVYSGLATHVMSADDVDEAIEWIRQRGVAAAMVGFSRAADTESCPLAVHRPHIDRCFSANTVGEIVERVSATRNAWGSATLELLLAASPQSLEAAFALIRRARGRTLADCLDVDLDVAQRMVRTRDFVEGVGAKLVDKGRKPTWSSRIGDPSWTTP